MARFGRKNKANYIFRAILLVPVLWFAYMGFTVTFFNNDSSSLLAPPFKINQQIRDVGVSNRSINEQILAPNDPDNLEFKPQKMELDKHENSVKRPPTSSAKAQAKVDIDNVQKIPFAPNLQAAIQDPNAPGELGKPVNIVKENLSPEERKKFDDGWKANSYNTYASDMISLHRNLPDCRVEECKAIVYPKNLPDTSVIIIFHNEGWSALLRTVHSVIDRTTPSMLKEVILVDDFSDRDHLKAPLEEYIAKLEKVRLVRNAKREGLIRARLRGAAVATGYVLLFLDSHCEATVGWLEPLVARIAENKSNVMTPVIDVISDETFQLVFGYDLPAVGGFDWNLIFTWHSLPEDQKKNRKSKADMVRSPTMAGGLFAISREYFEYLGAYDPGMDIWGGENLELSFRTWMCGGTLETSPCSHVGHVFRKTSPYTWKTGENVMKKNSVRLAEVWMDEYKNYYYERLNFDLGNYGDVTARKELRTRLKCKSFDWFIKNIYPDLFIPGEALASGDIVNSAAPMCLDASTDKLGAGGKPVIVYPCHKQGGNQYWMLSKTGEIRRDDACLDYNGESVIVYPCHGMRGNQEWSYDQNNRIRQVNHNLCLAMSIDRQGVNVKPCTGENQIWTFPRKTPKPGEAKIPVP